MVDKEEKNQDSPQASPADAEAVHASAVKRRKWPNRIFDALNYVGFGFLANSTLSLWITYNVMPTKPAQEGIKVLEKGLTPVVTWWDKIKGKIKPSSIGKIAPELRHVHVTESARSAAEICCMFIAGCIVLFPMKFMEDHRQEIVDKIDRWWNRKHYRDCDGKPEPEMPDTLKEKEDGQSWGELVASRLAGMAACLGIDNRIQSFNNHRFDKKLPNLDTYEWKRGAKIYDSMSAKWRDRFINFFSRKNISAGKIQPMVQKRLIDAVGNDTKRMIFSEQTRLFSKEISLTMVMAAIYYAGSKVRFLFRRKDKTEDAPQTPVANPIPENEAAAPEKKFTDTIKPKERLAEPEALYADKIAAQPESAVQHL